MGTRIRDSSREFFKKCYLFIHRIYSLLLFVVNNKDHYKVNSEIYSIITLDKSLTFINRYQI
jgi:hypothetical protein